ncbi:hypothetical protein COW38_02015 [Candidatus Collierbacteria bacterium CG17_big_fil_post_rev_8_21_14_2_50_45_7]|uniref:DUF86 domain-containing protein n=2 Tax=Candidatus Collieribacteriota TaxID=1752725 RepID=A0A2H0WZR8_9BACT|nr:MAG: hypothetical protein COT54_00795 [Candidatus Collierbacteria bacterium CG09_land_8_20_14_0_10_46_12]PIW07881.1 MAG: hypothetical protein COW38_02015 [Candidatus Collierbacteria bacterium CG17_big_fil_post_rev_8_21_14_2_50_45_7]
MNPLDNQIVTRKCSLILLDLTKLETYKNLSINKYVEDDLIQAITERYLEKILTRVIDINYHILTHKHKVIPKDYTDSFDLMLKFDEITEELHKNMRPAAGLRNHLSHEYDTIDPEQIYKGMQNVLKYLHPYLKHIFKNNPEK